MQRRIVVGVAGAVLPAVLVLGTVDTFVWLPLDLAPGIPLDRIYAALSDSGDLPYIVASATVWLVFWSLLTAIHVVGLMPLLRRLRPAVEGVRPVTATALGAILLGAMGFFHWWSAFSMGMSVSDELPPYVGGTTTLGVVLALGGLGVGAVGVALAVLALLTRSGPVALAPVDNS